MLIGRATELEHLRSHLRPPPGAPRRIVLLEGALGIGKTALLNELLRTGLPSRVLFSRADEVATNIPLDGIRPIVEEMLGDDLSVLLKGSAPHRLQRRLRTAVAAEPSVVVVDDAHWLDPASVEALAGLIADPSGEPGAVLLCARTGLIPDALLQAASRGGCAVYRVALQPLDDEEAAALLAAHGAGGDTLIQLAGGNPLFLHLLAETGATGADGPDDETPFEIGDALRGELSALSAEDLRLLQALSLTPAVSPETAGRISDADADAVTAATDRLARRGLVDAEALEVAHPFIRTAAYRSMSPGARRRAHRIAAAHAADVLSRAAHLQRLGAHLAPDELDALVRAAEIVSITSPASGVALLTGTRRLPHPLRDRVLARSLLLDGRPAEAEAVLRGDPASGVPAGEALSLLLQSLRIQGRPQEAFELVRDAGASTLDPEVAVELATLVVMHDGGTAFDARSWLDDDDIRPGHAAALAGLRSLSHLRAGDLARGREEYRRAMAGFDALGPVELLPVIDAITAMGWSAHFLADFEAGAALVERGIALAEGHGRFHVLPHLYLILAFLCIPLDRCDEADELIELSLHAAERHDWPDAVPLALTASLVAAPGRVPPEELAARFRRLQDAGLPRIAWWRQIVELFLARAAILLGLPFDAAALTITGEHDAFSSQKHIGLGEWSLAQGDVQGALDHAGASIAWAVQAGHLSQQGHGTMLRARIEIARGRPVDALQDLRAASDLFERAGTLLYRRLALASAAQLEAAALEAAAEGSAAEALTRRERDVADLVAEGLSNRAIAERLHLSIRTVESHVAGILRKTGLRSRAGIARHLDAVR